MLVRDVVSFDCICVCACACACACTSTTYHHHHGGPTLTDDLLAILLVVAGTTTEGGCINDSVLHAIGSFSSSQKKRERVKGILTYLLRPVLYCTRTEHIACELTEM